MNKEVSRRDYTAFLLIALLGRDGTWLSRCCSRAYRDFSRTVHGVAQHGGLGGRVQKTLEPRLELLTKREWNQSTFDRWHHKTCDELIHAFAKDGYKRFTVGQAQKWVNMALKYIHVVGPDNIDGFGQCYDYCHAPLDNYLIAELAKDGFPPLAIAWSRLDDYGKYIERQKWIRDHYKAPPLDTEYRLWLQYRHEETRSPQKTTHSITSDHD